MNLSTIARVKAVLELSQQTTDKDAIILALLTTVSVAVEAKLRRAVQIADFVETFDTQCSTRSVQLRAYPVADVQSVQEDSAFGSFSGSEITIEQNLWRMNRSAGILTLVGFSMRSAPQALQVTYTGGMAANEAGFIAAYQDIAGAVDLQTAMLYRRLGTLGTTSTSVAGQATTTQEPIKWLKFVEEILERHTCWNGTGS